MRRVFSLAAVVALALVVAACGYGESAGGGKTVNWYVFKEPGGAFDAAVKSCTEAAEGRYRIKLVALPTDANQQRELLVRRLAAKDKDVDLIGMDVIWTAEFAEAGWIRPWGGKAQKEITANTVPALLDTAKYKDKLWGAPLNTNTQLLFYRKDRVKTPPKTWDEMIKMAEEIGGDGKIQVQGAQYEGLTVWFNTLVNSAGDRITDEKGTPKLGKGGAKAAEIMRELATSKAADPSLSNSKEDPARLAFESGGSSFMVNYTFVYPSAKENAPDVFKNLGVARFPGVEEGKPSKVTLGGINLGVSAYSKKPDLAFEAGLCLRNKENQIKAAELGGLPPTIADLYQDPAIKKAFPFADLLEESLRDGVPRPVTPQYADISLAVQKTLHPPRSIDPEKDSKRLADAIKTVINGGLF
ncbi:MAG: ABC transporter substrate-binding protein [Solirubrobacterales bacterium]|nr:ABC transporter substrate-binding protein [Solirubrobacterales bacterium]